MTAAAEALLTPHREPLAPSGASFASRLVSGLAARGIAAFRRAVAASRVATPSRDLAAPRVPTLSHGLAASRVPMLARALTALRALAPYAAIELLLPGGSLVALVLWLYRRYKKATPAAG